MQYVYHASTIKNLKVIEPRVSIHGHSWVYAMKKPEEALMYLSNATDLVIATGTFGGKLQITERFEGALEYAYKNVSGTLYTLDGAGFQENMTSYSLEVVSAEKCPVIAEEIIDDNLDRILKFESEGKIIIYRFPSLPTHIPADKSDLVKSLKKFKENLIKRGVWDKVLDDVKRFHPDILDHVVSGA